MSEASQTRDMSRFEVKRERSPYAGPDGARRWVIDQVNAQTGNPDAGERIAADEHERRVNPSRTPGQGGYLAPPGWFVGDTATAPRFTRQLADAVVNRPLPPGVQSINVPRLTTGTATSTAVDNAPTADTDLVDAVIGCPVCTIAGAEVVALQVLEQSPPGAGAVEAIVADLAADYNRQVEAQILNGSGAAGQMLGLLNTPGIGTITFTNASPTASLLYPSLGAAVAKVAQTRGTAAGGVFVLSASRAAWLASSEDNSLRPLGLWNAPASGGLDLISYRTVLSDAMPRTINGTQEPVLFMRPSDCVLYESEPTVQVAVHGLEGTIGARIIYRRYAAWACRYPSSVAVLTGTGMVPVL